METKALLEEKVQKESPVTMAGVDILGHRLIYLFLDMQAFRTV